MNLRMNLDLDLVTCLNEYNLVIYSVRTCHQVSIMHYAFWILHMV